MQLPNFLTQTADNEILLTGHRIGLFHVVQHYNEGESAEMLACRYPTLPLSLVHKTLAFYLDNLAEVDEYVRTCQQAMEEQQQSAKPLDLSLLRRRLADQTPTGPEAPTR